MGRFWSGFLTASVLWGAALGAVLLGVPEQLGLELGDRGEDGPVAVVSVAAEPALAEGQTRNRRRRRRRGRRRPRGSSDVTPTGNATTGDDLGEDEMQQLDLTGEGGGQERLPNRELEAAFDAAMPRIRRCLVLMAGSDPVTGRVTFGVRIAPSGRVEGVQLSGPRAATTGEAGDCLRTAARTMQFRSFDGPAMVARFPLTLE